LSILEHYLNSVNKIAKKPTLSDKLAKNEHEPKEDPMSTDALASAIRTRNVDQARSILLQLQQYMQGDRVAELFLTAIEDLAWHEGDVSAAQWLLKNTPAKLKRSFPLQ
jgi:hypothetical protein